MRKDSVDASVYSLHQLKWIRVHDTEKFDLFDFVRCSDTVLIPLFDIKAVESIYHIPSKYKHTSRDIRDFFKLGPV